MGWGPGLLHWMPCPGAMFDPGCRLPGLDLGAGSRGLINAETCVQSPLCVEYLGGGIRIELVPCAMGSGAFAPQCTGACVGPGCRLPGLVTWVPDPGGCGRAWGLVSGGFPGMCSCVR